jgi:hypothetical protein
MSGLGLGGTARQPDTSIHHEPPTNLLEDPAVAGTGAIGYGQAVRKRRFRPPARFKQKIHIRSVFFATPRLFTIIEN